MSESSSAALFRAHERVGTSVATWVLARTNRTDAADAMRRAVDRLLSFDPGLTALDDVLLVLDGAAPSLRRGDARLDGFQLPCCTPVESSFETYEEEEDPEEDELGESDDPWVDENVVGQLDVAITELPPEEEEPEEDPEPGGRPRRAAPRRDRRQHRAAAHPEPGRPRRSRRRRRPRARHRPRPRPRPARPRWAVADRAVQRLPAQRVARHMPAVRRRDLRSVLGRRAALRLQRVPQRRPRAHLDVAAPPNPLKGRSRGGCSSVGKP